MYYTEDRRKMKKEKKWRGQKEREQGMGRWRKDILLERGGEHERKGRGEGIKKGNREGGEG